MSALALFERMDLVDDDRPDIAQILPGSECVIDPFVGSDDHVRPRIESVPIVVDPACTHPERHVGKLSVGVAKILVFLVCKRDERNEKDRFSISFEDAVDPGHLPDEGFSGGCCAHNELIFSFEQSAFDGEALYREELVEPPF